MARRMTRKIQRSPDEADQREHQPDKLNLVVYRILNEADYELANYYLGAHKALVDSTNPERYASSAHSLRELIEKLPDKHTRGVRIERPPSILSSITYEARDSWSHIEIDKTNRQLWQLPASVESNTFLRKSEKFWEWFSKHYLKRDEQRLRFLQGINKGASLPPSLQEKQLELWGEYYSKFSKIAHHREEPNDFPQLLADFEDFIIRELEPQTTKDFSRISALIIETQAERDEHVPELIRLVRANRPNYDHFFLTISSPVWLTILEDNQLMSHIDEPVPTDDGGYMLLSWVPGQYYEKIASAEPERVAEIIASLPKTENVRVHEQLIDIAKKMPVIQSATIIPSLSEWLKGRFSNRTGLLPFKIGEYLNTLTSQNAYKEAVDVFLALFELQPPHEKDIYFRHPETLTSDHSYQTILDDTLPGLMQLNPKGTITLLCNLLDSGLVIERETGTEKDGIIQDLSTIWRPDIRFKQYDHEPNDILVTQIYKRILEYAKSPEEKLSVIDILTSYKYEIFHRLAATVAENEDEPTLKAIYDKLVTKVGEPNRRDFIVSESNVTPAVSVEDMQKLTPEDLISLLNTWDPKEDLPGFGRSRSDIGFVLSQYTQQSPEILRRLMEVSSELSLEYYSHLFRGIRQASDNKQVAIDWSPILKYSIKFIQSSNTFDSEGDERQAQFDLINAIESGINLDHIRVISPEIAGEILAIFLPLCAHIEPRLEDEARNNKNGGFDPVTLAINTVRGEAISGLISLLKNVSRNKKTTTGVPLTKAQYESIYTLLESHLDTSIEPTLAIRTVYARELPFLAYNNPSWVQKNLAKIFPLLKTERKYFVASIEAFLDFTKPFPEVFPLISPYLVEYMKLVQSGEIKNADNQTTNHVIGQILILYIDDFVKLDDPSIKELFKMPAIYLDEAMDFFGRGLMQTSGNRQKLVLRKAKAYWEKRLDSNEVKDSEYAKFGWWLHSSMTNKWIIEHFIKALHQTDKMGNLYFVADELVKLAKSNEANAVSLLLEIVSTQDKDNLVNMLYTPELRNMLKELLESKDIKVRDEATRAIDKLCSMGFYNFSDLIDGISLPI
jgi:hypothetical protein